jgi:anti-sigma factor RsiW
LIDWLEGELPPDVAEEVAAHVKGCADCAREVEEIRAAVSAVSHSVAEPGEAYFGTFYGRVQNRVAEEYVPWTRRLWNFLAPSLQLRPALALASTIAIAVLSVTVALLSSPTGRALPQFAHLHGVKAGVRVNPAVPARQFVRVDPTMRQAVTALKKDEVTELQAQMARVMMGRFANSRVVVLPGAVAPEHVANPPAITDLNDQELSEVLNKLTKDVKKWSF